MNPLPSVSANPVLWLVVAAVALAVVFFVRNAFKGQGRSRIEEKAKEAHGADADLPPPPS